VSGHDEIERVIKLHGNILDDREWDRLDEVFAEERPGWLGPG
jgi:hypothetical protein